MPMKEKPLLSFWQIWNMCFGFLGIQIGFALQNANVSRIFQTLGADIETLPLLWVAAPLTGLVVQPIIGYMSDHTWSFLGRRRPYFFFGAIFTTVALIFMPHSPSLWMAAGALWILDASINITMEPFRAFVGDLLSPRQRTTGYVMQSFFIASGAVVASALPWVMANWFNVANVAEAGLIPDSVRYSFYIGAATLLFTVMWTVFRTQEYSPEELANFEDQSESFSATVPDNTDSLVFNLRGAILALGLGLFATFLIAIFDAEPQLYILSLGTIVFGVLQYLAIVMQNSGRTDHWYFDLCRNFVEMPDTMKSLAWVQLFSWFAFFALWIYTTAAVTDYHYGTTDPQSALYNQGADWVGVLFASYNAFAVIAAMVIPFLIKWFGIKRAHQINLLLGALGLASFFLLKDPAWLLLSMSGVGFAWASIVSLPYVMLANAIPANRMGVFMGIFNFFIVIPQLLAASLLGLIIGKLFSDQAIYALLLGGVLMVFAAIATQFVDIQ